MSEFDTQKQAIIKKLLKIVGEAAFWMPKDCMQELRDDIGFYVVKELERLECPVCATRKQRFVEVEKILQEKFCLKDSK